MALWVGFLFLFVISLEILSLLFSGKRPVVFYRMKIKDFVDGVDGYGSEGKDGRTTGDPVGINIR